MAVLEEAASFGRERAMILLYQLKTMLGDHDARSSLSHVFSRGNDRPTWELDATLVSAEILPVLAADDLTAHGWGRQSTLGYLREYGSEPVKELIGAYSARGGEPVTFGVPAFDAAVRAVDPGAEDAWPRLKEALALWRPLTEDHLAPISLMGDPRLARLITRERGRELLATRRG
jgi:hypothetical protein